MLEMPIEQTIANLSNIYQSYLDVFNNVENRILNLEDSNAVNSLMQFQKELIKFDAKLRLGMAVREILLNEIYVTGKIGDLKVCHLMLYKLADIWFSYETFFKLYYLTFNKNISSRLTMWLEDATNVEYSNKENIQFAITKVNIELKADFNIESKRSALKAYLLYCGEQAKGNSQKTRLNTLAANLITDNTLPDYNHTEILSMTYAIRNNFVHNGEITLYPPEFSYDLKNRYLKILYKYLVLITITATIITTEQRILNS